eukprot:g38177.t1
MTSIHINGTKVERVDSIKFLGVTITDNLSWTSHVDVMVEMAQKHLFFFRRLRKFDISIRTFTNIYGYTTESILSGCTTVWYGNYSAQANKKLQKVMCTAQTMTEANLPTKDFIYTARYHRKADNIIKDSSHS